MDIRVLLFIFVLSTSWCCNARVVTTNLFLIQNGFASELQINHQEQEREAEAAEEFGRNKQLCTMCEEFAASALGYLAKNKTQTEIISILHKTCSKLLNLEQQCITLVDYYAPLFFLEVSTMQPEEFCSKIDLCERVVSISQQRSKGSCEFCHHVVTEALEKLEDPDTKLINGQSMWPNKDGPPLDPPKGYKQPGRPKKARKRDVEESKEGRRRIRRRIVIHCKKCGKSCHNMSTCTVKFGVNRVAASVDEFQSNQIPQRSTEGDNINQENNRQRKGKMTPRKS